MIPLEMRKKNYSMNDKKPTLVNMGKPPVIVVIKVLGGSESNKK
jgi:hypothetical protein